MDYKPRYDFSQYDFPNEIWIRKPAWEVALKTCLFLPIIGLGVVGNLFIFYLIGAHRFLRTSINLFILSLSVSDFITIAFFPWVFLCIDLYQNYILGAVICRIEGFLRVTLMLANVFSLTAVSIERLVAIAFPFRPKLRPRGALILIGFLWIISAAIASPLVIYREYMERQWRNFLECWCKEDKYSTHDYYLVLMAILVWFPLLLMSVCYILIFIKLGQYASKSNSEVQRLQLAQRRRVAKMLVLVLICFIICWTPFTITVVIRNSIVLSSVKIPSWLRDLLFASHYLMYASAAINPIIYGLCNDNFRRAIRLSFPNWRTNEVTPVRPLTGPDLTTHFEETSYI